VDITKPGDISLELHAGPKPAPGQQLLQPAAAAKAGVPNPNSAVVWHFEQKDLNGDGKITVNERMNRTISTVCIDTDKNLVYAPDFSGFLHCFDAKTGELYWVYDTEAAIWGSCLLADGKVYLCDEEGKVMIFESGKKLNLIAKHDSGNPIYCSPVLANGTLYIMNREFLYAISEKK